MSMSDDFLNDLVDEVRAAYNPPPDVPVEALWRAVRERRAYRDAYNAPGATPRDAIWAGLQARRADRVGAAADASGTAFPALVSVGANDGTPDAPPTRQAASADRATGRARALSRYRWVGWAAPIAATLLVGIAIGRSIPEAPPVPSPAIEEAGGPGSAVADGQVRQSALSPGATESAAPLDERLAAGDPASRDRAVDNPAPGGAPLETPTGSRGEMVTPASETDAAQAEQGSTTVAPGEALFRMAAIETLGGAEALLGDLVASRVESATASAPMASWGRDMLSQTRLLLDSPAADDPALRVLLEDLEMVLVQLVRFGEGPMAQTDAEFLEDAVRGRQILSRIRALLPGEVTARGT